MGLNAMIFIFWMLSFKPGFSLSSLTFIMRPFSSSSISAIRVMYHLRLLYISEVVDISPSNLDFSLCFIQPSSFHDALWMKLNKEGDNIQPWCTPFPIWNQSVVPGPVLTIASWPAYRFLKRQVRWSGIPTSLRIFKFIVIHTALDPHRAQILIAQLVKNSPTMQETCLIPGLRRSAGEGIGYPHQYSWASLVAQMVKNLPAVQETWVWSLGWEDPLEKGKATHSSILAWRIPWTVYSMVSQRVRHNWVTFTSLSHSTSIFCKF